MQLEALGADTHFGKAQGPWGMWRGCGQEDNEGHVRGMSCRGSGEVCRVCSYLLQQLCFAKPASLLCIPAGKAELTNEHAHEKLDMEIELVFSRFKLLRFLNVKVFSCNSQSLYQSDNFNLGKRGNSSNRYMHTSNKYIHGCMIKKKNPNCTFCYPSLHSLCHCSL